MYKRQSIPKPEPAPGEVLIRVAYAGINPADWKDREGYLSQFYDIHFPHIVGFDAAGTVDRVGEGVTAFAPGDRVLTVSRVGQGGQGSYAEFLPVPADRVAKIPDELPLVQAAVLPVAALTAWQALFDEARGKLQPGQAVLINGGSGGVGTFAVQFARQASARVAASCSGANADYVRQLGADLAIDYRQGRMPEAIAGWAGGGVDLLYPHHECERVQSEAITGRPFVRHWLHQGMVHLHGRKMSKSDGNLRFVHDLRERHEPMAIRLALGAHHYRRPWPWTDDLLDTAAARLDRWRAAGPGGGALDEVRARLDDDLDVPGALAAVDAASAAGEGVAEAAALLGVDLEPPTP